MSMMTVQIPDDLKDQLEAFCREHGLPFNDVVRDSLRRYLAVEQFRALRRKTLPFAEAQGILTDDDVFRAIS
jgi:Arc/MetJ-type ribon-helix-helix transcriptional regulator